MTAEKNETKRAKITEQWPRHRRLFSSIGMRNAKLIATMNLNQTVHICCSPNHIIIVIASGIINNLCTRNLAVCVCVDLCSMKYE